MGCAILFFVFKPAGLSWWRIVLEVIFCVALGHQLVRGILAMRRDSRQGWIELLNSMTFVFFILAVLLIPKPVGWVLVVVGYIWRLVVLRVFK
jgi:hypothetical protein